MDILTETKIARFALTALVAILLLCGPVSCASRVDNSAPPVAPGQAVAQDKPANPGPDRTEQESTEKLSGYRTPAEYLFIPSRHYPKPVVAVALPLDYKTSPDKKYPLVIAFGGMGECMKPPQQGSLAWIDYYKADEAVVALANGRLSTPDFRGLVTERQLEDFNARLQGCPYDGIILACPYSPVLKPGEVLEFPDYEAFVIKELVPALKRRYRVAAGKIGVDGVSMGGARSMYYGFKYPEIFASIGSVQGAFGPWIKVYKDLVRKNRDKLKGMPIQLVASDRDHMATSVANMHRILKDEGITHRYMMLTGPHDYIFNQGPGSLALLVFHNQALRRRAQGPVK